ncbi:hypothetical protein SAMN05660236_3837 [Ohtaekwangia koreensis]|uniref:Uncharacterized protein n=2 Tax=Ohtaekwangia koreensis TaxID=688867 RepID=A0A1T5LSJ6_9BACT|nr:hypothetical protein SAMN05660236_3837 [Ohtaekwangia koreensis]
MFGYKEKIATKKFVSHIELLAQRRSDRDIIGYQKTEKELMREFIFSTRELVEYNEHGVGLENLLENIYEISFTIDQTGLDLAKEAIKECGMSYQEWSVIEDLVR